MICANSTDLIPPINPLTTSFRELKSMVASTAGKKLPSAKALREETSAVLFIHEHDDCSITVFTNGFFIYECYDRETVFAVDRCKEIHYQYSTDEVRTVFEHEFADGPCLVPLLINGDGRVVENLERYWKYWEEFSLNSDGAPRAREIQVESAEDALITTENSNELPNRIRDALLSMTQSQYAVFQMYVVQGLTQVEIAGKLGISQPAVKKTLDYAVCKFQKKFF